MKLLWNLYILTASSYYSRSPFSRRSAENITRWIQLLQCKLAHLFINRSYGSYI